MYVSQIVSEGCSRLEISIKQSTKQMHSMQGSKQASDQRAASSWRVKGNACHQRQLVSELVHPLSDFNQTRIPPQTRVHINYITNYQPINQAAHNIQGSKQAYHQAGCCQGQLTVD